MSISELSCTSQLFTSLSVVVNIAVLCSSAVV